MTASRSAPTSKAKPTVKLYLQWSDEDNDWSLDDSPSPKPKRKAKPLVFGPATGSADIIFELRAPHGKDWKFAANPEEAISACDDSPCPPPDGLNSDQLVCPQFKNQGESNEDRTVLIVTNNNNNHARLVRYKLHVVDETGAPLPVCDPAILNGGTGSS